MQRIGDLLANTHGDLLVSKYRLRQAERIELVRRQRAEGRQTLGFNSRLFVLCGYRCGARRRISCSLKGATAASCSK